MDKKLEDYLWSNIPDQGVHSKGVFVRDVINDMVKKGMIKNPKQAWRTLEKWCRQKKYNYGTCLDLGWKENE